MDNLPFFFNPPLTDIVISLQTTPRYVVITYRCALTVLVNLLTLHEVLTNFEPPEKKTTNAEVDDKEETEENNVDEDPTTKLLIARKKSSEKKKVSSKLTR